MIIINDSIRKLRKYPGGCKIRASNPQLDGLFKEKVVTKELGWLSPTFILARQTFTTFTGSPKGMDCCGDVDDQDQTQKTTWQGG